VSLVRAEYGWRVRICDEFQSHVVLKPDIVAKKKCIAASISIDVRFGRVVAAGARSE
jgi:hypothetical protein